VTRINNVIILATKVAYLTIVPRIITIGVYLCLTILILRVIGFLQESINTQRKKFYLR
jgi:hypothetical protein